MSEQTPENANETPQEKQEQENNAQETTSGQQESTPDQILRIAELEGKLAETNDKYLRLYSDFDNYRKRTAKERIELIGSASEEVVKSLLPVIDDLERAIKNNEKATDISAVNEGINLVAQKFRNILTQKGLEVMDTTGKPFDVDLHEAITNIPAPSEDLKGKVVDEVEKGYLLNGKVIRYAKVVVGN
jgi:molecular chaperone GrpE